MAEIMNICEECHFLGNSTLQCNALHWHTIDDAMRQSIIMLSASQPDLLHIAADIGCAELVTALLDAGSRVHLKDLHGNIALVYAAAKNHYGVVDVLLKIYRNNVEAQAAATKDISSALVTAVKHRSAESLTLLLQAVPAESIIEKSNETLLHVAASLGYAPICEKLLNYANSPIFLNAQNETGSTALAIAASKGFKDVVALLLDRGADIHVCDKNGRNILHQVSSGGNVHILESILLRENLDTNDFFTASKHNTLPIDLAISSGVNIVQLILTKMAEAYKHSDKKNEMMKIVQRRTAARNAASNGYTEVLLLLLKFELNHKKVYQDTLLQKERSLIFCAVQSDRNNTLRKLLEYLSQHQTSELAAYVQHPDVLDTTPLALAKKRQNGEAIRLLEEYGAAQSTYE